MSQISQLALAVQLPDDETFSSYKTTVNQGIVAQLQHFINDQSPTEHTPHSFYLFGLKGVGKSHLLHACSAYAASLGKSSLCLSFSELKHLAVEVLDGLEIGEEVVTSPYSSFKEMDRLALSSDD